MYNYTATLVKWFPLKLKALVRNNECNLESEIFKRSVKFDFKFMGVDFTVLFYINLEEYLKQISVFWYLVN